MISLPNLLGFVFWILENKHSTRIVYLVSIYGTYLTYMVVSAVESFLCISEYFKTGYSNKKDDFYFLGIFFIVYGFFELFLALGFEDYNYL